VGSVGQTCWQRLAVVARQQMSISGTLQVVLINVSIMSNEMLDTQPPLCHHRLAEAHDDLHVWVNAGDTEDHQQCTTYGPRTLIMMAIIKGCWCKQKAKKVLSLAKGKKQKGFTCNLNDPN